MDRLRRWWPLIAILALAFNLRPVAVSIGPVLTEISRDLGLTGATAGVLTSLPTLCFAVFGALAPTVARRLGTHVAILAALVLLILGQGARLLVHDRVAFLVLSMVALAGMAVGNVLLPTLVRQHYPHRVGLATALYSLMLTVGVTLASTATVPLATALGGWRGGLSAGVLVGVAALLCWLPLLHGAAAHRSATVTRVTLGQISRTKLGWALAILFGCQSGHAYTIFGWLPSVYRSAGLNQVDAGLMLGIATGAQIVPAFLIPAYVARTRNPSGMFLAIISLLIAGYVGLMLSPTSTPWLWALLLALGTSSFPLILALFGTRARTPAATAAMSGFAQSIGYSFATIGPLSFGILHTLFDSWVPSISLQLALIAPMVVAGLYACRPQEIEDELAI